MKTILFVCTANICRSPMATAIMRQRIATLGLDDQVTVQSAGVWAEAGHGPSSGASTVLEQRGMSLSEHRSQPMTASLIEQADIVLVMEESHRRSLFHLSPKHLAKVFLLTEMSGGYEDIADPFGGPLEGYEVTARQLEKLIEAGLPKVLKRIRVA